MAGPQGVAATDRFLFEVAHFVACWQNGCHRKTE